MFDDFEGLCVGTVTPVHDPGVVVGGVLCFGLGLDEDEPLVDEDLRDLGLRH